MMKNYKADPERTENLIQKIMKKNNDRQLLSADLLKEMSTDKVTILAARLDNDLEQHSSHLSGYAKLETPVVAEEDGLHVETEYVHFWFDIYSSGRIWNEMAYIKPFFPLAKEMLKEDMDEAVDAQLLIQNTVWGKNGIYKGMPTIKPLSEDDLTRCLFVRNMQDVSRKYKWGQEARKMNKK